MEKPAYTVALCTHNHLDRLRRTLVDLAAIASPRAAWELLIVDNGCSDGTTEFLASNQWSQPVASVRVVREDTLGLSHARNRAIAEAAGDYIIFIDDDETPDANWLCAYERCIEREHPDAMGGAIDVLFVDGDRPAWLQDELLGFIGKLSHGAEARALTETSTPIFGGNFGFRKATFERIGRFDIGLGRRGTANIGGEDTEIYRRLLTAQLKVWWVPESVIYHRIESVKLRRRYFLDLHFHQGRMEGVRTRGTRSCMPPKYLFGQLYRAVRAAWTQRRHQGSDYSLRLEMNFAYFVGYILGWTRGTRP
ncbi:MAG: glycosyltransferase family 2 protein [Thiobacillaceae bacterium]